MRGGLLFNYPVEIFYTTYSFLKNHVGFSIFVKKYSNSKTCQKFLKFEQNLGKLGKNILQNQTSNMMNLEKIDVEHIC